MCVFRHHQLIAIVCCGRVAGASNYVHWWRCFKTRKNQKRRSSSHTLQTVTVQKSSVAPHLLSNATKILLSRYDELPSFRIWCCRSVFSMQVTQKTFLDLIWAARASGLKHICRNPIGIAFQTTSKCSWGQICKTCISCGLFCCPQFQKSIQIQCGYAKKKTHFQPSVQTIMAFSSHYNLPVIILPFKCQYRWIFSRADVINLFTCLFCQTMLRP